LRERFEREARAISSFPIHTSVFSTISANRWGAPTISNSLRLRHWARGCEGLLP
jgi:hypothetical protein